MDQCTNAARNDRTYSSCGPCADDPGCSMHSRAADPYAWDNDLAVACHALLDVLGPWVRAGEDMLLLVAA